MVRAHSSAIICQTRLFLCKTCHRNAQNCCSFHGLGINLLSLEKLRHLLVFNNNRKKTTRNRPLLVISVEKTCILFGHKCHFRIGNDGDSAAIHQDRSWGFTKPEKPLRRKKALKGQLPIEAHNGPSHITKVQPNAEIQYSGTIFKHDHFLRLLLLSIPTACLWIFHYIQNHKFFRSALGTKAITRRSNSHWLAVRIFTNRYLQILLVNSIPASSRWINIMFLKECQTALRYLCLYKQYKQNYLMYDL